MEAILARGQTGLCSVLQRWRREYERGATWKEALKSTIKPTIGTVLSATADQIVEDKPAAEPPPVPPIAHSESVLFGTQGGCGSVKRRAGRASYKKSKMRRSVLKTTTSYSRSHIIYNY